jgi:hypothetical protein
MLIRPLRKNALSLPLDVLSFVSICAFFVASMEQTMVEYRWQACGELGE